MKKLSFLAAILICGLVYTTCDLFKDVVKEPEVTLDSVEFTKINFTGLTLLSNVKVKNNMSVNFPFPKIDGDLNVFDIVKPLVSFSIPSGGTLKSNDSTVVPIESNFTYAELINLIAVLADENKRENPIYKIKMTAYIPVQGVGDFSFPFTHEGKIPIARKPDLTVASKPNASLTYGSMGIPNGGNIEFSLNFKNNSNVAIVVNALSYDLKIGSTSLKGGVDGKPNIDKGSTNEIKFVFPLTVENITSIGVGVLTGSNFSYSLTGNYKFALPEFPFLNELGDSFTLQ